VLIARDAVTLRLWEVTYGELPVVLFGALVGLVEVAVVSLSVYGLVRAIGLVIPTSGRLSASRSTFR
jgi:hypothetical protein